MPPVQLAQRLRAGGGPGSQRLTWTEDGRLRYELNRGWKDGRCAIILSPLDLCARVYALTPRPGFHMVRYYGRLSSHMGGFVLDADYLYWVGDSSVYRMPKP